MTRPIIGSAYQAHRAEHRTPITYSSLRPTPDNDAALLQRALLADASRRARSIRSARTKPLRRALAHRVCFDLLRVLRGG
jgi:hypothetical protein